MKVYGLRDYPSNFYFVHSKYWGDVSSWMRKNNVDYTPMYSGPYGEGFVINTNFEWFSLRWL